MIHWTRPNWLIKLPAISGRFIKGIAFVLRSLEKAGRKRDTQREREGALAFSTKTAAAFARYVRAANGTLALLAIAHFVVNRRANSVNFADVPQCH